jgi:hypothetical protein
LALLSAILPRSSKYVLVMVVVATFDTSVGSGLVQFQNIYIYRAPGATKHPCRGKGFYKK